jgi:F-type H+-transporting ATPase subunit gamma
MASTREIQSRIKSIQDTMKITNAMYMISSTKLRKAKSALENTEPYFYAMQSAIARILRHIPDVKHPFFNGREEIPKEERKIGYLVVTADKGLAGAYNHNIIKLAEQEIEKHKGISRLYVIGQLGVHYFEKKKWDVDMHFQYTAQDPSMNRARNIAEKLIEAYIEGDLDTIYIIYTIM